MKKAESKEKDRLAFEKMRDVFTRVRTNTMAATETDTMAVAETNTMAVAETDTMAEREAVATTAVESNVAVAETDVEERAKDGDGWEREKTYRKYSVYWIDSRWSQKWTGVSQPWRERHQADKAESNDLAYDVHVRRRGDARSRDRGIESARN